MPENSFLMPTISMLFIYANICLYFTILNLSFGSHFGRHSGGHFEFEVCDQLKNDDPDDANNMDSQPSMIQERQQI